MNYAIKICDIILNRTTILKGVAEMLLFFLLIIFSYLYDMEQFTKAELYGKTLELQHENEQLKNQLILTLKNNE
tara:strand:- start:1941 stop:2162 length:222 start_codon:yes stop_codon:yes gene_type:complete